MDFNILKHLAGVKPLMEDASKSYTDDAVEDKKDEAPESEAPKADSDGESKDSAPAKGGNNEFYNELLGGEIPSVSPEDYEIEPAEDPEAATGGTNVIQGLGTGIYDGQGSAAPKSDSSSEAPKADSEEKSEEPKEEEPKEEESSEDEGEDDAAAHIKESVARFRELAGLPPLAESEEDKEEDEEEDEEELDEGIFGKKAAPAKVPQHRINQATVRGDADSRREAEEWGGKDFYSYSKHEEPAMTKDKPAAPKKPVFGKRKNG